MSVLLLIVLYYLIISRVVGIFLKPNPKKQTVLFFFLENFPVEMRVINKEAMNGLIS